MNTDSAAIALASSLRDIFPSGPRGVIFDCDGVLVDSRQANIGYYNLLRQTVGLPPMSQELENYVHMSTGAQAMEAIIPPPLRPLLRRAAQSISYLDEVNALLRPMPGLKDVLDLLRADGVRLAINTNRMDSVRDLLGVCELEGYFDPVVTVSGFAPKPDPEGALYILEQWRLDPGQTMFIGDSQTDLGAARAAGIPFLSFADPELADLHCQNFFDLHAALRLNRN